MERLIFDFNQEPQNGLLKSLLLEAMGLATICGLVVQGDFPANYLGVLPTQVVNAADGRPVAGP